MVQRCIKENTLIGLLANNTKKKFNYIDLRDKFSILNSDDFYPISQYFETYILVSRPDIIDFFSYMIGCSRLLRNLAFIDIWILVYYIAVNISNESAFIILLTLLAGFIIFFFFIIISSLLEFYYYVNILHTTLVFRDKENY